MMHGTMNIKIEVNNPPSLSLNPLKNFATKFHPSRTAVHMPNSMFQENNINGSGKFIS
jgi:hypothetical protein